MIPRERGGVVVERRTPNQEVLGSIPTESPCCVLEQDTLTPCTAVLVKPRNSWLRPDMTETLLTGTLSLNTNTIQIDGTRAYKEIYIDEISVVNAHLNELPVKFSVCVKEGQDKLPTMYWLPKRHKRPSKASFIANSSSCTTTELSKLLTFCLTAIESHAIRYYETVYETLKIGFGQ